MLESKILSLGEKEEWTFLLKKLPFEQQDVYYSPEYYSLYENYGDGKALCFVFEKEGDLALYPFLLNSINKLGYDLDAEYYDIQGAYGYNGVASSSQKPEFIISFYSAFDAYCKANNIIAEFSRFHPLLKNNEFSKQNLNIVYDRKTVYVDLSETKQEIFAKFQNTTRKQIRRSINRHKIEVVKKINDTSFLDSVYEIYQESMDRVNSIEYLRFNRQYFEELLNNNNTIQFIAIYNNKPVGVITAIIYGEYMHGHLGGALTAYINLSVYSLLYWEMIKVAKEMGVKYLHIGGGSTNAENDQLLEYKKHFSNHFVDFNIGKKIHHKEVYEKVFNQWVEKYPESYKNHKNKILGYREIE